MSSNSATELTNLSRTGSATDFTRTGAERNLLNSTTDNSKSSKLKYVLGGLGLLLLVIILLGVTGQFNPKCPNDCSKTNGTCKDGVCSCNSGFTGTDCSGVTDSSKKSCLNNCYGNNGVCNTKTGDCSCNSGFTGTDCSSPSVAPSVAPSTPSVSPKVAPSVAPSVSCPDNCSNNGSCNNGICACYDGFIGTNCSTVTCKSACSIHGKCVNGSCSCNFPYSGNNCENKEKIYNLFFGGISGPSLGKLNPNGSNTSALLDTQELSTKFETDVTIKQIILECGTFTLKSSVDSNYGNVLLFNIWIFDVAENKYAGDKNPKGKLIDNFQIVLQNKVKGEDYYSIPGGIHNFFQDVSGKWIETISQSANVNIHNKIQAGQSVEVQYVSDTANTNTPMKVTLVCT